MRSLLFLFTWHLVLASDDPRNESIDIHIIGFFPCTHSNDTRGIRVDNCDGIDRIPIMKLALEEINGRCDLLPGYRLVVDYATSGCSSIPPVYHFIQQTDPSQPTKLMILGTACSASTQLMGEIAERIFNITQVAYTASSPLFGQDKTRYPRFYRLGSMGLQFADSYIALVAQESLNWRRVAVIHYTDDLSLNLALYTMQGLRDNNIRVILDFSFSDDTSVNVLEQIKKVNARIIIAWLPPSLISVIRNFWCKVIHENLAGPDFVWMLPGWYSLHWWNVTTAECTAEEMNTSLEHSLIYNLNHVVTNNLSRVIISGKNVSQFQNDLLNIENTSGRVEPDTIFGIGYVYDAMWTIALALNSSISILEDRGLGRLEDFTYDSVEMANVFTEAVANVSFEGISGSVAFQQNGDRMNPSMQIRQYRGTDGVRVPIMNYDPLMRFQNLPGQKLEWQGGPSPPRDSPMPSVTTSSLTETVIAGVVSSVGILSAITFLTFNLCYNKHPVVKRSSYRLNSLILVAVLVGFVGTLLHVIKLDDDMAEPLTTTICNAKVWCIELAVVVAFGTLFVKVWRLYKVFFNKKLVYRKYLSDKYLFLMVAVIAAPVLLLLIVRAAAFPLTLHTITEVNENDYSTEIIYYECRGEYDVVFLAVTYAEDFTLALFSVLVAYETQRHIPRHNKLHKYHESAVVNLTTLLAVLLSSVCQVVLVIFKLNNVHAGILLLITLRDCLWMFPMIYLLFIPKLYKVCRGSHTTLPHQVSAVGHSSNSARTSFSSLAEGRYSNVGILERRSSSRASRRSSTSSIISEREMTVGSSSSTAADLTKKEVMFSPIHERSEDELPVPESYVVVDSLVQFIEEPRIATRLLYQTTEV